LRAFAPSLDELGDDELDYHVASQARLLELATAQEIARNFRSDSDYKYRNIDYQVASDKEATILVDVKFGRASPFFYEVTIFLLGAGAGAFLQDAALGFARGAVAPVIAEKLKTAYGVSGSLIATTRTAIVKCIPFDISRVDNRLKDFEDKLQRLEQKAADDAERLRGEQRRIYRRSSVFLLIGLVMMTTSFALIAYKQGLREAFHVVIEKIVPTLESRPAPKLLPSPTPTAP
jgi:hypothetical protein